MHLSVIFAYIHVVYFKFIKTLENFYERGKYANSK